MLSQKGKESKPVSQLKVGFPIGVSSLCHFFLQFSVQEFSPEECHHHSGHGERGYGIGDDLDFPEFDGPYDGWDVLVRLDKRVCSPELPEKMAVRCPNQRFVKFFCNLYGWLIEIDEAVVILGKFDCIEEVYVCQQV